MALPAVVPINLKSARRLTGFSLLFDTDHSPSRRGDTMLLPPIRESSAVAPSGRTRHASAALSRKHFGRCRAPDCFLTNQRLKWEFGGLIKPHFTEEK
jgi:hypothetical protein